ncbi:hypothetical protein DL1_09910 [Thioclava dalianensis]|uniref:Uncharacterized protein n=1 Tax=Thioclava dalianensis TaxID=1185766 RepID=A0A074THQ1_9RHOB|nr:hypothetical protein [Thioclava dalianensis]KEP68568.1 hypothetical protein DL1_09910 [Thioclava dalianensis]
MSLTCVLTGDLVASSRLTGADLANALERIEHAFTTLRPAGAQWLFARNRGDGWQIAMDTPPLQARLALLIRAELRSLGAEYETRIAIAQGRATIPESGDLNSALGPAFTASGQLLDTLEGPRIAHAERGALGAALRLLDHLSEGWTPAQARAMAPMLHPDPPTQTAAARAIGITRQSLAQALGGAAHDAIIEALAMIEAIP